MQARNRTWLLGSNPVERCRQRTMNVEGGDGSTLSLDFTTGVLDPRLLFTRTTNATFINSQGYVEWAAANALSNSVFAGASGATQPTGWLVQFIGGTGSFTLNGTELTISNNGSATRSRLYQTGPTGNGLPVTVQLKVVANNTSGMSLVELLAFSINGYVSGSQAVYKVNGTTQTSGFTGWVAGDTVTLTCIPATGLAATCVFGLGVSATVSTSASVTIKDVQIEPGSVARSYIATTTSGAYQAPRFDYDPTTLVASGLLIEGSASNYVLRSELNPFASPTWQTAGTTLPTITTGYTGNGFAPDNTSNPTRVQFAVNGGSASRIFQPTSYATNPTTANPYTVSVWMKSNTAGTNYTINILGTAGSSAVTVTPTWQRFTLVNTSGTSLVGYVYISNESGSVAADVLIWGAQLEAGNGASSYIPTGVSTGNRAYDHCYATGTNFTSWFSTGAGTLVAVSDNTKNNTQNLNATISDDSTSNYLRMGFKVGGASNEYLLTTVGGPSSFQGAADSGYAPALNTVYKMAYAWDTNNFAIVANGGAAGTDTSGTLAGAGVLTRMVIGGDFVAVPNDIYFKNGHIRSLKYWPTRLSNAQLQDLTNPGDTSTLTLNFTNGTLDPRVSHSRAGGGTYVGPDGFIYGIDSATSASLAIGTGLKSVTLTATAGTNRRFEVGQTVYFSNGANNMSGAVTAYSPSTQVITINAASTSGSGSFTSWVVGNASPRFDYNPATLSPRGLLIEGAKDNICNESENFGTWAKLQAADVVTANAGLSPDGQQNAYKVSPSSVTGSHGIYRGITVANNTTYTESVYAKAGELNWLFMTESNTLTASAWFDLATGTVGTISGTGSPAAYMQNAGNGWWRCVLMFTTTGSQTTANIQVRPTTGNNVYLNYVGNGVDGIYAWGAQAEADTLSSYIPTDASQRSRVADSCSMTGTNFSSWFNSSEGTFTIFFETIYAGDTLLSSFPLAFDNSASKRIVYLQSGLQTVASFDGTTAIIPTGDATGIVAHVASAYSATDRAVVLNGGTVATGTIAAGYATATSLDIGAQVPFITIKQIKYYPTRLTNAQLQGLTK